MICLMNIAGVGLLISECPKPAPRLAAVENVVVWRAHLEM